MRYPFQDARNCDDFLEYSAPVYQVRQPPSLRLLLELCSRAFPFLGKHLVDATAQFIEQGLAHEISKNYIPALVKLSFLVFIHGRQSAPASLLFCQVFVTYLW